MIGDAKLQKNIDMKIYELLNFNKEMLNRLRKAGIRLEDCRYIDLYSDYQHLRTGGAKLRTQWPSWQRSMESQNGKSITC